MKRWLSGLLSNSSECLSFRKEKWGGRFLSSKCRNRSRSVSSKDHFWAPTSQAWFLCFICITSRSRYNSTSHNPRTKNFLCTLIPFRAIRVRIVCKVDCLSFSQIRALSLYLCLWWPIQRWTLLQGLGKRKRQLIAMADWRNE